MDGTAPAVAEEDPSPGMGAAEDAGGREARAAGGVEAAAPLALRDFPGVGGPELYWLPLALPTPTDAVEGCHWLWTLIGT